MRKNIVMVMLCTCLTLSFSACAGCGRSDKAATETEKGVDTVEQEVTEENDQENTDTESDAENEISPQVQNEEADAGDNNAEDTTLTPEAETGDYEGLEVADEISIDLEEGQEVVIQ